MHLVIIDDPPCIRQLPVPGSFRLCRAHISFLSIGKLLQCIAAMPRKIVPIISNVPYHVTARCINQEWFSLPLDIVWSIMEDFLYFIAAEYKINIHAFVLMSNHFHLLVTAPQGNLSMALLYFLREVSKEITRLSGRINQTFGGRNHKTLIEEYNYFMSTYKYIYQNPLRAGICERVEEYPYSTLHGLCGLKPLIVPLVEDTILFNPDFDEEVLKWLNTRPDIGFEEEMRIALRRPILDFNISRKTRKQSLLTRGIL